MPDVDQTTAAAQIPLQPAPTTAEELAQRYLAAWNAHDGAAVAALVTGSYSDPTLTEPLRGAAIAEMVQALCAAFPDLAFVASGPPLVVGDELVLRWRMRGTNDGAPLPGAPAPTSGTCDLAGVDVITLRDGRIVDVVGYFDQKTFVEQLGLQTFVMPKDEWPAAYGTSVRVDLDLRTTPGAVSFTWIDLADDAEHAELVSRSQEIVMGLAGEPGFLGWMGTTVGRRSSTVTMWTSPEAAESALARSRAHTQARERVQQEGFGTAGFTGIWQPYRLNAQFVRCTCGQNVPVPAGSESAPCACGRDVVVSQYL